MRTGVIEEERTVTKIKKAEETKDTFRGNVTLANPRTKEAIKEAKAMKMNGEAMEKNQRIAKKRIRIRKMQKMDITKPRAPIKKEGTKEIVIKGKEKETAMDGPRIKVVATKGKKEGKREKRKGKDRELLPHMVLNERRLLLLMGRAETNRTNGGQMMKMTAEMIENGLLLPEAIDSVLPLPEVVEGVPLAEVIEVVLLAIEVIKVVPLLPDAMEDRQVKVDRLPATHGNREIRVRLLLATEKEKGKDRQGIEEEMIGRTQMSL